LLGFVDSKLTTLRSLLIVGACVASAAELSRAADTVYSSGDFGRANGEMTSCPAYVLLPRHSAMDYLQGTTPAGITFAGSWSRSTQAFIWIIIAEPTGPKSSHVELHNKSAKPEEIDEVWQVIEDCARK
jgi:hypothetical protein